MDWEKTSIKLTLLNKEKYTKGYIVRTFNNIVPNPKPEQLKLFGEAIELLSDGDTFSSAKVVLQDKYIND
ncbi:DUF1659 domain-containing protein [Companilactobacillus sp.]|jgi:hypothetical protein|uniref:DUF1659 domain-containing protein n=1 Tax=Companilactobacillus sp. TaxID=2767905 RepID=UPI0025BE5B9C|nr:hypothetical protein [Companilactobacillus sp.]MCH4009922.1 hypothetical protein [Companilactobacillus sp.]MCH4052402.1 hypothetical protein [Companilactobacillus sp.]MCH4077864.1 hypothetical protein [Companilactobacillus sp.]MCH4126440.1 hypothetical protein [Companilactobacillus sp.]MCH4132026.1 hypothetical protein [Companilactobacillus sp.]